MPFFGAYFQMKNYVCSSTIFQITKRDRFGHKRADMYSTCAGDLTHG